MNIQNLRQSLKHKWLIYYNQNISWLVKMRVWGTYDGLRRPLSGFILATLSVLEPQFDEILAFMLDLNNDPDKIVIALGLNFNPDEELRLIKSEHSVATSQVDSESPYQKYSEDEKLHPQGDGVFGHGEWGMGHGEEVSNAQCPVPEAAGRLSLSTHKGMEFPAAFNKDVSSVVTDSKIASHSLAEILDSNLPHADQLVPSFTANTDTEVVRTRKPELVVAFATKTASDTPVKTPSSGFINEYQPLQSPLKRLPSGASLTMTTEVNSKAKTIMPSLVLATEVSSNSKPVRSRQTSPSGRLPLGAFLAITTEINSNGKPVRSLSITTELKSNGKHPNIQPQDVKSRVNLPTTNARSLASWVDEFCQGTRWDDKDDIFI
ncbi:DUF5331 domain-containing protein [Nostoc sp. KVJ20]|uniref:DUF5331 domain-containing protein n=1 Tax=Nostoc sp. KVJ20 TaxID=457944 RepID=UPI000A5F5AA6